MSKLVCIGFLSFLATLGVAQTYPTYSYESRSLQTSVPLSSGSSPQYVTRYVTATAQDIDSVPTALMTYLNRVRPSTWSFGQDFSSSPEYMASKLYTDGFHGTTGGLWMSGAFLTQPEPYLGQMWFQGRFYPSYMSGPSIPENPPYYPMDGKSKWVVVVKETSAGYQILPSSSTPYAPSYYNLQVNGQDDASSNGGMGAMLNPENRPSYGTGSNYTKLINIRESVDLRPVATTRFYTMLCDWGTDNMGRYSVTIRDAILFSVSSGSGPVLHG